MYINAMNRFQLSPKECLILEDNENGIKAALASKAHLLKIDTVEDVNYQNIMNRIKEIGG
jgi:beta-phosphoglucomutase-like phosphatase (HAD superfamily)